MIVSYLKPAPGKQNQICLPADNKFLQILQLSLHKWIEVKFIWRSRFLEHCRVISW